MDCLGSTVQVLEMGSEANDELPRRRRREFGRRNPSRGEGAYGIAPLVALRSPCIVLISSLGG